MVPKMRIRTIRYILIGVIGIVSLSVLFNYLAVVMRKPRDDVKQPPMISTELRSAAEGVEIFVRKGSDLRFTVRARRLTETVRSRNILEGIEASDFNYDGSVRNIIYSDMAVYDPDRRMLEFDGNVRVLLGDDVELHANAMYYDLETEVGAIPGKMEFLSGNVSGRARDARFFRNEDRLELGGEADFLLTNYATDADQASNRDVRATAARGTCLTTGNRILLSGGVRIEAPDMGVLSADAVDVELNRDRSKIAYMTASGDAFYEMRSGDIERFISGDRMVFTAAATGSLEKALISNNANLQVKSMDEEQTLRAGEIELLLDSSTGAISEINGTTGADFHVRRGVEETLAVGDTIYAVFAADAAGKVKNARISGHSLFSIKNAGNAANELRSETIEARFREENGDMENLAADGGVYWKYEQSGASPARTLLAENLELRYADAGNYPESGEASGMVTIEETSADMTAWQLKAGRMLFEFFSVPGQIKSLTAEGGVRAIYDRAASHPEHPGSFVNSQTQFPGRYQTSSENLVVLFVPGKGTSVLRRATQSGNFRFVSDGRSAAADSGEYDAVVGKLTLTGAPEILDAAGRINSDSVEYDLVADELLASGRVRAVINVRQSGESLFQTGDGASPVVVTAEALRYRLSTEVFQFSGGVDAMAERQQLHASEIAIGGGENMTADGGVIHRIYEAGADAIIQSGQMKYLRDEGVIRYSGKVEMKSGELALSADTLNAAMDNKARDVRHVTAQGNVFLRHDGRTCRGDAAEWIPATSGYIVTGSPAMLDDPARGRSMARRLTYVQDEDRITLEP